MRWAGNGERSTIVWMFLAACAEAAAQVIRLQQTDPTDWLVWDYAGRLATLALLFVHPKVRRGIYRRKPLEISLAIVINRGLLLIPILCATWIGGQIYQALLPDFRLGAYPRPQGWLLFFDLTAGLALVAFHEELFFRRGMRLALHRLGEGPAMILASSVLFAAHHWWTGIPNMIMAGVFGWAAMRLYIRSGAIWPLVVIHYLADLWFFT